MTQTIAHFKDHTMNFVWTWWEGSDDFGEVQREAKDFLGTAARVVFAAAIFFTLETVQTRLPMVASFMLGNVVSRIAPETDLGMGAHSFYKAARRILTLSDVASIWFKIFMIISIMQLISGVISLRRYDQNHGNSNFVREKLDKLANYFAPIVAQHITHRHD